MVLPKFLKSCDLIKCINFQTNKMHFHFLRLIEKFYLNQALGRFQGADPSHGVYGDAVLNCPQ